MSKRFIVHLDGWTQIPHLNHHRTALSFRAAVREAERVLRVRGNRMDIARLYEPRRGWLRPEDAELSLRLGADGGTVVERRA